MSVSYRRLVQHDFGSVDGVNHYCTQNENSGEESPVVKTNHSSVVDLFTQTNIIRDAMDNDTHHVLPVNFPVVGSILLEFVNALSIHMGWSSMIKDLARNASVSNDGFYASDLNRKLLGLVSIWASLLSCMDRDSGAILVGKVSTFTESFFDKVEKERYIFFVEEGNDVPSNQSE